jgi:nitrite reductase (cytochrome c-552)
MLRLNEMIKNKPWIGWLLFFVTAGVVFLLGVLASSILERRMEAVYLYKPQIEISQFEPRNEVWGKAYPREYETYSQMADTTFRSAFNGSAMIDMITVDPRLVVLWAGYGFSKDYNQSRGHVFAVKDIHNTLRTGAPKGPGEGPMPSTCWTCKSPDVPRLMNEIGFEKFYEGKWADKGPEIINPIGCADCHDPETMSLRITRPALIEAFARRGRDITEASLQEMRSLVCAQCHVEYYFKGEGNYLTLPWDNGFTAEDMETYYDEIDFQDWTHSMSRASMLKAQHPGYEVYMTGIHAERGVSCADCHMPYKSVGGQKFTDHKVQSPLNNIANSCQVCHRENEKELTKNVYDRQKRVIEQRDELEKQLVRAHVEAKMAWEKGAAENQMEEALLDIRHAQWRWDYAAASHGGSFHSPIEILRTIASGMAQAQEARVKLARILSSLGYVEEVPYPDISTKTTAQKYIGLDIETLNAEKQEFISNIVPQWMEQGREREKNY